MYPESGRPRECHHVAIPHAVAFRRRRRRTIDRREDSHVRIVHPEPKHAANRIRQPRAHLRYNHKTRLLRRYRPFVQIFLPIDLEIHRSPTVRHLIRPCTGIFRHIQIGSLEVIAHRSLHISHRELAVGLDIERHRLLRYVALDKIGVTVHRLVVFPEERPDTGLATAQCAKVIGAIGCLETEIFVFALEISLLAGKFHHVRGVHTVFLVVERDLLDARLVGVRRNAVVGDADSHPNGTFPSRTFPDHLHNPCLVLVGDGKGLSATVIAVFSHQICHYLDGLARRLRALEGNVYQTSVIHDARRVHQLGTAPERALRDGHLIFVHVPDNGIRLARLLNLSQRLARIPLGDLEHRPFGPNRCRPAIKFTIQRMRIRRITNHHRPIRRGFLPDQQTGASIGITRRQKSETGYRRHPKFLHILLHFNLLGANLQITTQIYGQSGEKNFSNPRKLSSSVRKSFPDLRKVFSNARMTFSNPRKASSSVRAAFSTFRKVLPSVR